MLWRKVFYYKLLYTAVVMPLRTSSNDASFRALLTKILTLGLICELGNPLDDWFDWLIPTSHLVGYVIHRLTQDLTKLLYDVDKERIFKKIIIIFRNWIILEGKQIMVIVLKAW